MSQFTLSRLGRKCYVRPHPPHMASHSLNSAKTQLLDKWAERYKLTIVVLNAQIIGLLKRSAVFCTI